jgi:hypothetical protein
MAKLTGDGGGAGGIPSTRPWESFVDLGGAEVVMARGMLCEYEVKVLAVVGGAKD